MSVFTVSRGAPCSAKPIYSESGAYAGCEIREGATADTVGTRRFTEKQVSKQSCDAYCGVDPPVSSRIPGVHSPNGQAVTKPPEHAHLLLGKQSVDCAITGLSMLNDAMSTKGLDNFQVQQQATGKGAAPIFLTELGIKALLEDRSLVIPMLTMDWAVLRPAGMWLINSENKMIKAIDSPMKDARQLLPCISDATAEALRQPVNPGERWIIWYSVASVNYKVASKLRDFQRKMEQALQGVLHPDGQPVLRQLAADTHRAHSSTQSPNLADLVDRVGLANCEMAAVVAAHKLEGESPLIATGTVVKNGGFVDLTARDHAWNLLHDGDDAETLASADFTPPTLKALASEKYRWQGDRKDALVEDAVQNAIVHIAIGILDGNRAQTPNFNIANRSEVSRLVESVIRDNRTELFPIVDEILKRDAWLNYARVLSAMDTNPSPFFAEHKKHMEKKWLVEDECRSSEGVDFKAMLRIIPRVISDLDEYQKMRIVSAGIGYVNMDFLDKLQELGFDMSKFEVRRLLWQDYSSFGRQFIEKFKIDMVSLYKSMFVKDQGYLMELSYEARAVKFLTEAGVFKDPESRDKTLKLFRPDDEYNKKFWLDVFATAS